MDNRPRRQRRGYAAVKAICGTCCVAIFGVVLYMLRSFMYKLQLYVGKNFVYSDLMQAGLILCFFSICKMYFLFLMNKKIEIVDIDEDKSSSGEEKDSSETPKQEAASGSSKVKESYQTTDESIEQKLARHQEWLQKLEAQFRDLLQKQPGKYEGVQPEEQAAAFVQPEEQAAAGVQPEEQAAAFGQPEEQAAAVVQPEEQAAAAAVVQPEEQAAAAVVQPEEQAAAAAVQPEEQAEECQQQESLAMPLPERDEKEDSTELREKCVQQEEGAVAGTVLKEQEYLQQVLHEERVRQEALTIPLPKDGETDDSDELTETCAPQKEEGAVSGAVLKEQEYRQQQILSEECEQQRVHELHQLEKEKVKIKSGRKGRR